MRPGRFEHSLTLAQGSALRPHWGLIHYRTQFESPRARPIAKQTPHWGVCFVGAPREIRTLDLPVRSRALYPLSYGRIAAPSTPGTLIYCSHPGPKCQEEKRDFRPKKSQDQTGRSSVWLMTMAMPAFLIMREHMTQGSALTRGLPFSKP